jgi:hypothetical protein
MLAKNDVIVTRVHREQKTSCAEAWVVCYCRSKMNPTELGPDPVRLWMLSEL